MKREREEKKNQEETHSRIFLSRAEMSFPEVNMLLGDRVLTWHDQGPGFNPQYMPNILSTTDFLRGSASMCPSTLASLCFLSVHSISTLKPISSCFSSAMYHIFPLGNSIHLLDPPILFSLFFIYKSVIEKFLLSGALSDQPQKKYVTQQTKTRGISNVDLSVGPVKTKDILKMMSYGPWERQQLKPQDIGKKFSRQPLVFMTIPHSLVE